MQTNAELILGLGKDALLVVLGLIIPEVWGRWRRLATLRLRGYVFPTVGADSGKPIIHIRASFEEVSFGTNPPTLRGYTHAGDLQAVMNIYEAFDRLPVRIKFDYFAQITREMRNIVIIGASSRSDVSRDLGQELSARNIRILGDGEHAHFRDSALVEYRCVHAEVDGRFIVTKDIGVIFRKRTETGALILLCGGIHTFGSQAAAEVAALPEFQKRVRKAGYDQFVQFVTVEVIRLGPLAGLGIKDDTICWKDLPLERIA